MSRVDAEEDTRRRTRARSRLDYYSLSIRNAV